MSRLALLLVVLSTLAIGAGCGSQAQSQDAACCAAAEELDALLGRAGDIQNAQQALEGTFQLAIGEARHEPLEVRFAIARGFVATARNIAASSAARLQVSPSVDVQTTGMRSRASRRQPGPGRPS